MQVLETSLPGVLLIEPKRFSDERGFFAETFHVERYRQAGLPFPFVQDNWSHSETGVLRGLHLQNPNAQGKLVSVLRGRVLDVAVDVRVGSQTFGRHVAVELSGDNGRQFFVPRGFAHGYAVLSGPAEFLYKCDNNYSKADEIVVRWNDPALAIDWRVREPLLAPRDAGAPLLADIRDLPKFEG
jgi:dTDP-4-dehydrorhamnose 3,5-epimerase